MIAGLWTDCAADRGIIAVLNVVKKDKQLQRRISEGLLGAKG